ncbi:hypothetical protein VTL71DRAFT_6153, partial [Oculimacula yallundae]
MESRSPSHLVCLLRHVYCHVRRTPEASKAARSDAFCLELLAVGTGLMSFAEAEPMQSMQLDIDHELTGASEPREFAIASRLRSLTRGIM